MGGIGDLLMMTPGLHALKEALPRREIHLAIPRRYFPLFEGNEDVILLDIADESLKTDRYERWANFSDCPAARLEMRTSPVVKKNRIEIFARALGLDVSVVRRMDRRPRYLVTDEERGFQKTFWDRHGLSEGQVVGIQLRAEEIYRDYPRMKELVGFLSRDVRVLVFDSETIHGCHGGNVIKVEGLPLRRAFALAGGCDAIIAPDSAFVHLAAALEIPCVALYGPIDGRVRTRDYPLCTILDARSEAKCLPCWRNERIPCRLTDSRGSVCMNEIQVPEIVEALKVVLDWKGLS
jgi:ADP-heptose:LPS heptosyltransferase